MTTTTSRYVIRRKASLSYFVRSNGMKGGAVWSQDRQRAMQFEYWDAARVIHGNGMLDYWLVEEVREAITVAGITFRPEPSYGAFFRGHRPQRPRAARRIGAENPMH